MTKVWIGQPGPAPHDWIYLHAIGDCCTREIAGWSVDLLCRVDEAIREVTHRRSARTVCCRME